jgi:diguanylate cyclase (GGDEF)-like protein
MHPSGIVGRLLEREDGVPLGTLLGTVASILVSVVVSVATLAAFGDLEQNLSVVLPIAILAPALIAPLFFWVSLSLLAQLERARAQLERISMVDELTGVCNRRRFIDLAEREIDRARRYDHPIALLVVDPDHLQDINESYGYDSGDRVLRRIAEACTGTSRKGDLVGRSGGEEFWILLSHCGPREAEAFAERLRVYVRNLIVDIGSCQISCTVSIGGCSMRGRECRIDCMMSHASCALGRAKRAGRNRSELAADPSVDESPTDGRQGFQSVAADSSG